MIPLVLALLGVGAAVVVKKQSGARGATTTAKVAAKPAARSATARERGQRGQQDEGDPRRTLLPPPTPFLSLLDGAAAVFGLVSVGGSSSAGGGPSSADERAVNVRAPAFRPFGLGGSAFDTSAGDPGNAPTSSISLTDTTAGLQTAIDVVGLPSLTSSQQAASAAAASDAGVDAGSGFLGALAVGARAVLGFVAPAFAAAVNPVISLGSFAARGAVATETNNQALANVTPDPSLSNPTNPLAVFLSINPSVDITTPSGRAAANAALPEGLAVGNPALGKDATATNFGIRGGPDDGPTATTPGPPGTTDPSVGHPDGPGPGPAPGTTDPSVGQPDGPTAPASPPGTTDPSVGQPDGPSGGGGQAPGDAPGTSADGVD